MKRGVNTIIMANIGNRREIITAGRQSTTTRRNTGDRNDVIHFGSDRTSSRDRHTCRVWRVLSDVFNAVYNRYEEPIINMGIKKIIKQESGRKKMTKQRNITKITSRTIVG